MPSYKPLIFGALLLSMSASYPIAASAKPVLDSITLNENGKLYQPFSFAHDKHIQLIKECSDCHHHTTGTLVTNPRCVRCHANSSPTAEVSCKKCHSSKPFSPETLAAKSTERDRFHLDQMGLKGAMHQNCIGCHDKQKAGPVECQGCHLLSTSGNALYNTNKHAPKTAHGKKHE